MRQESKEVSVTKIWIKEFVLKNKLCPFASMGFQTDTIYYAVSYGQELKDHLEAFWRTLQIMLNPETHYSNAFLILQDEISFDGIMKLSSIFDEFLIEANMDDIFQIVEFHPQLLFGDHEKEDPAHFINRSPYPMIHILRKEEVAEAIESHPDITKVPLVNIDLMRNIGYKNLSDFLRNIRKM